MTRQNKTKYLVVENNSGGKAVLEYTREMPSSIPYRQVYTNGGLDFSNADNIIRKSKLEEKYKYQKCETKDKALRLAKNDTNTLKGTSNVRDQ